MPKVDKYTAFYIVNREIRGTLDKLRHSIYKNQGDYLLGMYGWVEEFSKNAKLLKENYPKAWREYFTFSYKGGLIVLNNDLVLDYDESAFYPKLVKGRKREMMRYSLYNTPETREKAIPALKEQFAQYSRDPATIISSIVENATNKLRQRGFIYPANEILQYKDNASTENEWFDVLAVLLIYAQSQMLPAEPPVTVNSQPTYNIFMASKKHIQDTVPLEERCGGAHTITLINYAGTGLIAGPIITPEVHGEWKHFFYNIPFGGTKVRIVLTDPDSHAAADAVSYKMRPLTMNKGSSIKNIISKNLSVLHEYMLSYPQADVDVYLTKVSLPCAYMKSEFDDETKDNIKIDLYLPTFGSYSEGVLQEPWQCDDQLRQSFMVYRKYQKDLYEVFSRNIEEIIKHSRLTFEFEEE